MLSTYFTSNPAHSPFTAPSSIQLITNHLTISAVDVGIARRDGNSNKSMWLASIIIVWRPCARHVNVQAMARERQRSTNIRALNHSASYWFSFKLVQHFDWDLNNCDFRVLAFRPRHEIPCGIANQMFWRHSDRHLLVALLLLCLLGSMPTPTKRNPI